MAVSLFTSLVLNLLILGALFFVTVRVGRIAPPAIHATAIVDPPEKTIEPEKLERPTVSARAGGSPPPSVVPVVAAAASELTLSVPDLPSADNGVAGLAGIGSGFGSGFGPGGPGAGGSMGSMKVGKITVKAMKLGVILDVSGSMEEELPAVKREVRRAFRQAETVEVVGCRLDGRKSADDEDRKVKLRRTADTVIEAVEMLVVDGKVDALYWFSDLQDGETEAGLEQLRELLRVDRGKGKAVRFYIRSLEQEPSDELAAIVKATDGAIQAGEKGE